MLVSKRGWGAWRRWIGAGAGGGAEGGKSARAPGTQPQRHNAAADCGTFAAVDITEKKAEDLASQQKSPSWGGEGDSDGHGITDRSQRLTDPDSLEARRDASPVKVSGAMAAGDGRNNPAALVVELGSSLDVELADTVVVFERWDYECEHEGLDRGVERVAFEPAVSVRAEMSLTMTTAFFLDGHWATELRATGSVPP